MVAFGIWPPASSLAMVGFATIDEDATILRSGGIVTAAVLQGTGNYELTVTEAAAGLASDDPNIAIMVMTDARAVTGAEWDGIGIAGSWNVNIATDAGAGMDTRYSVVFYKG